VPAINWELKNVEVTKLWGCKDDMIEHEAAKFTEVAFSVNTFGTEQ